MDSPVDSLSEETQDSSRQCDIGSHTTMEFKQLSRVASTSVSNPAMSDIEKDQEIPVVAKRQTTVENSGSESSDTNVAKEKQPQKSRPGVQSNNSSKISQPSRIHKKAVGSDLNPKTRSPKKKEYSKPATVTSTHISARRRPSIVHQPYPPRVVSDDECDDLDCTTSYRNGRDWMIDVMDDERASIRLGPTKSDPLPYYVAWGRNRTRALQSYHEKSGIIQPAQSRPRASSHPRKTPLAFTGEPQYGYNKRRGMFRLHASRTAATPFDPSDQASAMYNAHRPLVSRHSPDIIPAPHQMAQGHTEDLELRASGPTQHIVIREDRPRRVRFQSVIATPMSEQLKSGTETSAQDKIVSQRKTQSVEGTASPHKTWSASSKVKKRQNLYSGGSYIGSSDVKTISGEGPTLATTPRILGKPPPAARAHRAPHYDSVPPRRSLPKILAYAKDISKSEAEILQRVTETVTDTKQNAKNGETMIQPMYFANDVADHVEKPQVYAAGKISNENNGQLPSTSLDSEDDGCNAKFRGADRLGDHYRDIVHTHNQRSSFETNSDAPVHNLNAPASSTTETTCPKCRKASLSVVDGRLQCSECLLLFRNTDRRTPKTSAVMPIGIPYLHPAGSRSLIIHENTVTAKDLVELELSSPNANDRPLQVGAVKKHSGSDPEPIDVSGVPINDVEHQVLEESNALSRVLNSIHIESRNNGGADPKVGLPPVTSKDRASPYDMPIAGPSNSVVPMPSITLQPDDALWVATSQRPGDELLAEESQHPMFDRPSFVPGNLSTLPKLPGSNRTMSTTAESKTSEMHDILDDDMLRSDGETMNAQDVPPDLEEKDGSDYHKTSFSLPQPEYSMLDEYEEEHDKERDVALMTRAIDIISSMSPETIDSFAKVMYDPPRHRSPTGTDQRHSDTTTSHEVTLSGILPSDERCFLCSICQKKLSSDKTRGFHLPGSFPIDDFIRCSVCGAEAAVSDCGRIELGLADQSIGGDILDAEYGHGQDPWLDTDNASSPMTSCAASVISVFSVESLASSASDLSKASGYSATQIATATKVLISIFHEDEILLPLYRYAIESPFIGPDRLERNLRRLIKAYAEHLDSEAKDRLEYLASRLVSIKARWLAESIVEKCWKQPAVTRIASIDWQDENSDDEADDRPVVNECVFEDLVVFRDFLTSSNAFEILRDQVQMFVYQRLSEPVALEAKNSDIVHEKTTSATLNPGRKGNRTWKEWHNDISETTDHYLRHPVIFPPVIFPLYILTDAIRLTTDGLMISAGLLEPPLHPSKTRLRWSCKCGDSLMSDVRELHEGGAAKLAARMEQHTGTKVSTTPPNHQSGSQQYIVPRPGRWLRNGLTKLNAAFTRSSRSTPCLPQHNTSCPSTGSTSSQATVSQPPILHLLACMHHNRFRKVLQQDRIETINTDRALLCFMRQQYRRHRGRLLHFLSLKSVQGIFFVKFRLPLGGSVDVRHHDPCCVSALTAQPGCECIPPKEKVEPSPGAEYRCIPGPPATYPPVPPEYLKCIFTCPADVDEKDTWILNQLPKRICGELQGKVGQPADGWGIYYQEGWDCDVIVLFVFVVFLLASLLFGILYSKFQYDLQGAFGVSAYIVALCTIIISLIASRARRIG